MAEWFRRRVTEWADSEAVECTGGFSDAVAVGEAIGLDIVKSLAETTFLKVLPGLMIPVDLWAFFSYQPPPDAPDWFQASCKGWLALKPSVGVIAGGYALVGASAPLLSGLAVGIAAVGAIDLLGAMIGGERWVEARRDGFGLFQPRTVEMSIDDQVALIASLRPSGRLSDSAESELRLRLDPDTPREVRTALFPQAPSAGRKLSGGSPGSSAVSVNPGGAGGPSVGQLRSTVAALSSQLAGLQDGLEASRRDFDRAARQAEVVLEKSHRPEAPAVREAIGRARQSALRASNSVSTAAVQARSYGDGL